MSIRTRNNKPTLVWFHKNGCPYCVQMKDEWEKTVTSLRSSGKANTEEFEKHMNPEVMSEYGITSYPTIVLITPNGKRINYNGRRNASAMVEFATRDRKPRRVPEVVLFHMNGCGHCKAMMPDWEKFKKNHPKGIKVLDYEYHKHGDDIMNEYGIQGFPTILRLGTDDSVTTYSGNRSYKSIYDFASS